MRNCEPNERNDWSFLGFLHDCISSRVKFRRLVALIALILAFILALLLVLVLAYALAKGDVSSAYDHLTRHATAWEKWGIPPGGIGLTFAAMRFFVHRRAARQKRAAEDAKAKKETKKAARKKGLSGSGGTPKPKPKKAAS